jgi:chromosome segregation ATPase
MESIVGQAREQYAEAVSITEARLGQQLADAQEHMAAIREQTSELEQELADTCTRAAEARELAAQRAHEQASRLAALDAVMTTERAERAALESENARLTTQVGSQLAELESNRVALTRLTAERDAKHRETEATEAHMEQVRAQSREARDEARAAHGDARQATATAAAAEERARALDAAHQRELAMLRDHTARLEATVAALRESKNNSQNGASKAEPRRRT